MQTMQGMVVLRARIEKHRQSDLAAARDTYTELGPYPHAPGRTALPPPSFSCWKWRNTRSPLQQTSSGTGLQASSLMSTGYKPVYEALAKFAASFPTGQKTNAAIIGRLMNNIKPGYYPTDPDHISLILRGIRFPGGRHHEPFRPLLRLRQGPASVGAGE